MHFLVQMSDETALDMMMKNSLPSPLASGSFPLKSCSGSVICIHCPTSHIRIALGDLKKNNARIWHF